MKKVISIIQQKGGVGKTNLTCHVAYEMAAQLSKLQIAVADADPQQSSKKWLKRGEDEDGRNIVLGVTVASDGDGKKLRHELSQIEADLILLDLPPAIESVSLRAALYSDLMLVPVGPSVLDIEAAKAAVEVCEEALSLDEKKSFLLIPSKVRANTRAGVELREVLEGWGPVSKATIGLRQSYSDAATLGEGVTTYAPKSTAHKEIQTLCREVKKILDLKNRKKK